MRYRKRISVGKAGTINVSKSGLSATAGIKGLSVNVGKDGAYLNTGIPGTGLYDRNRIGGGNNMSDSSINRNVDNDNRNLERLWNMAASDDVRASFFADSFNPPIKTFSGILSFFLFIGGIFFIIFGLFGIINFYFGIFEAIPLFGIGVILYVLHHKNHQKAKKNHKALIEYAYQQYAEYQDNLKKMEETKRKIIETKINAINTHELFDGAKIFTIDINNIIAFSQKRCVAIFTEQNTDTMQVLEVDKITKINQEIKSGDCFAHIYTDSFENNVIKLYIGTAHGTEKTEEIRKLYNEIKNLYTTLKNKKE